MKDKERKKPEQEKENYAKHLSRVTAEADHRKALLQQNYKALHTQPPTDSVSSNGLASDTEE